jgi:hypothetical protein
MPDDLELAVVRRYFCWVDEWWSIRELVAATPMVTGSTGQQVANPLGPRQLAIEGELQKLERMLGIHAFTRAELAEAVGVPPMSALELMVAAEVGAEVDVDPRIAQGEG